MEHPYWKGHTLNAGAEHLGTIRLGQSNTMSIDLNPDGTYVGILGNLFDTSDAETYADAEVLIRTIIDLQGRS